METQTEGNMKWKRDYIVACRAYKGLQELLSALFGGP